MLLINIITQAKITSKMVNYKPTTVTIDIKSAKKNQLTKLADFLSPCNRLADFLSPCSCWVLTGGIIQCKEMNTHTASTHKHSSKVMTVQSKCMCVSVMCDISK